MEIEIENVDNLPEREIQEYLNRTYNLISNGELPTNICRIEVALDGNDEVTIRYYKPTDIGIDRIRRITGYLVGTLDRFNDAKRAEERDRVKHSL